MRTGNKRRKNSGFKGKEETDMLKLRPFKEQDAKDNAGRFGEQSECAVLL